MDQVKGGMRLYVRISVLSKGRFGFLVGKENGGEIEWILSFFVLNLFRMLVLIARVVHKKNQNGGFLSALRESRVCELINSSLRNLEEAKNLHQLHLHFGGSQTSLPSHLSLLSSLFATSS